LPPEFRVGTLKIGYRLVERRGHLLIRLTVVPALGNFTRHLPAAEGVHSNDRIQARASPGE
jgi:hypothetical protein